MSTIALLFHWYHLVMKWQTTTKICGTGSKALNFTVKSHQQEFRYLRNYIAASKRPFDFHTDRAFLRQVKSRSARSVPMESSIALIRRHKCSRMSGLSSDIPRTLLSVSWCAQGGIRLWKSNIWWKFKHEMASVVVPYVETLWSLAV